MVVDIAAFSDTHNKHRMVTLPTCDIAIFSGDLTSRGYKNEVQAFLSWYTRQSQATTKVWVPGNHDICFDPAYNEESKAEEWLQEVLDYYKVNHEDSNIHLLINSSVELFGLKIWGSPITPWFHGDRWAFNRQRGSDIKSEWDKIPMDTDIIVTHGPPYMKWDYVHHDDIYVGCIDLEVKVKKVKPKLHIFGHIHQNWGIVEENDTIFCNAAVLNHNYFLTNQPHLIKLEV